MGGAGTRRDNEKYGEAWKGLRPRIQARSKTRNEPVDESNPSLGSRGGGAANVPFVIRGSIRCNYRRRLISDDAVYADSLRPTETEGHTGVHGHIGPLKNYPIDTRWL